MTARPRQVRVRAHGPTARASALVFGDTGPLLRRSDDRPETARTGQPLALCGPEPACAETAAAAGLAVQVFDQLRGPDCGLWTGRTLAEVAALDPAGLAGWLADPDARPHGGETLAELVGRLSTVLQLADQTQPGAASGSAPQLWLATPLVVRALVVAALGAPPGVIFAVDVPFGGEVLVSGSGRRWRLQGLTRG